MVQRALHGMDHLRFHQESRWIRPVPGRRCDSLPRSGKFLGLDFRKRAGPRDAGDPGILEFIAVTRIQRDRSDGGFPFAIGRARRSPFAGDVADILDLKRSCGAAYVYRSHGFS